MIIKIGIIFLVFAAIFYFPQYLPRLFRFLGKRTGQAGRLGKEMVTGVEVPGSVLAEIETATGKILLDKALATRPRLPRSDQTDAVARLGDRLAEQARVVVVPGSPRFFGPAAAGHIRLSIATSRALLEAGLDRLEAGLRETLG